MRTEIKKLFTQTSLYGLGTILPRILNYSILTPFYTRVLTTSEYGTFSFFYAYVSLFLILFTYGMETAYFRFFSKEKNKAAVYGTSLLSLAVSSTIFVLGIILWGSTIAQAIDFADHPEYVYCLGLVVATDAFSSIIFARLRVENKALKFSAIKLFNVVITLSSIFLLFEYAESWFGHLTPLAGNKVFIAFFCNLLGSLFSLILLLPELLKTKLSFDGQLLKRMLRYAYPLLLVGIFGAVNENIDKIVLKYLLPQDIAIQNLGIYAANYKIAVLMAIFIQMFRYAAEPFFFNQHQKSKANAKVLYAKVMKYFVAFCLFIFLVVTLYIDIIQAFIGENFTSGVHIVPIVLLANLFLGIYFNLSIWYKLTNKTLYGALIAFVGVLVTLGANLLFIPSIGYLAAAWATFSCYFVMMVLSYFLGQKHYPIEYPLESIALYSLSALSLFFISELIVFSGLAQKLAVGSLLLLIYVAIVYLNEKSDSKKNYYTS